MTPRRLWPRLVPPRSYGPAWPQSGRLHGPSFGTGAAVLLLLLLVAAAIWLYAGHHHPGGQTAAAAHTSGYSPSVASSSGAAPSAGLTGSNRSGIASAPSAGPADGPQTFRHPITEHHHHIPIRFLWDELSGFLSLAFLVGAYLVARRPAQSKRRSRLRTAAGSMALIAAACMLVAHAITVPDSSNAPSRAESITQTRRVLSNGDTEITEKQHIHHFHRPIAVSVDFLLLAGGLLLLAARRGLTAARRSPKNADQPETPAVDDLFPHTEATSPS